MALNENAKAWVAALRSGEYAQGQEQLRVSRNDGSVGYCCLGVGGDLFAKATGEAVWQGNDLVYSDEHADLANLDGPAREWLGLNDESGHYKDASGRFLSLAGQNDSGSSFDEIADIIESEPEGLFITS